MSIGRIACLLCLQLGFALSSRAPASAAATDPYASVLAHEERGDLAAALRQLRASEELLQAHREHEAALVALLRTFDVVQTSIASNQHGEAQAVLQALLPKLDPLRDAHLVHAVHRKLIELRAETRNMAETDVGRADQLVDEGKHAEAIAIYADIVQADAPEIPAALKRRARQALARAQTAKAEAEAVGFWGETWKSVSEGIFTLAGWSVFLLAGTLLVWSARTWRKRWAPRDETLIALEDLTVQASEREAMSQGLIREILLRFRSLGRGDDRAADIDTLEDIDGSCQANLRIEAEPLTDIDSVIQDGTPVQIGPFALSPRQLVVLFRAFFRRPWRSVLAGSLVNQGDHTILLVERIAGGGPDAPVDRWEARASGNDARLVVVQKMATRLAFELAKTRLTSDWRSFEAFRRAMEHLDQAESESCESALEQACVDLQRSLRHDPANWIARFHLATTQRKLGRNESAAKHLEFLGRMAADGAGGSGPMARFVQAHPEFLCTIRYNRAAALAKIPAWEPHHEALGILDDLVVTVAPGGTGGFEEPARIRLEMLARSARAAALLFELERPPSGKASQSDQNRRRKFQEELFGRIEQEKRWIRDLPLARAQLDWKAYSLSYAAAHNAYGRACFLIQRKGAVEALRDALTMAPDFTDSYITLAEIYMESRQSHPDWNRQALDLLTRALGISPSNQKAHYLLGKLLAHPAVADYEQAKLHLGRAELFPWSYILLAEILAREDGNAREALRKVRRSIALSPEPDHRHEVFVRYALQVLAEEQLPDPDLLAEARDVASRLAKKGRTPGQRRRGERLFLEVQAFRKTAASGRSQVSAPAVPAGPTDSRAMDRAREEPPPCPPAQSEAPQPAPLPPPPGVPPIA